MGSPTSPAGSPQSASETALLVDANLAQIPQVTFSADSSTPVAAIGNGTSMVAVGGPTSAAGLKHWYGRLTRVGLGTS
jgi:hypothetical protein